MRPAVRVVRPTPRRATHRFVLVAVAAVLRCRVLVFHILKLLTALTMEPNAAWQGQQTLVRYALTYKRAILQHKCIPVLMDLIVVPLSLVGASRHDQDTGLIELVLCLVRNLLQVRRVVDMGWRRGVGVGVGRDWGGRVGRCGRCGNTARVPGVVTCAGASAFAFASHTCVGCFPSHGLSTLVCAYAWHVVLRSSKTLPAARSPMRARC